MKFVDIKNDVAFRKIFGNENRKETLISFLNAILDFRGNRRHSEYNFNKKRQPLSLTKAVFLCMVLFSWDY